MIAIQKRTILKYLPIANILFWITNIISYISTYQVVFQGKPYYVRSYLAKTVTTNLWSSEFIVIVWLLMRMALYDACFGNDKYYDWACFRPALSDWQAPIRHCCFLTTYGFCWCYFQKKNNRTVFNFCFLYKIYHHSHFLAKKRKIDKSTNCNKI